MQDTIQTIVITLIPAMVTGWFGWFLARRQNNAAAKTAETTTEMTAYELYKALLDDTKIRLEEAIKTIKEQDKRIRELLTEVELLTEELRKYKQLNGKSNESKGSI